VSHFFIWLLIASGYATKYDPGVFEQVVENRIGWGQLEPDVDPALCVALLDCNRIGDTVWLKTESGAVHEAIVCDCAASQHRAMLEARNWAVDLSPELAEGIGLPQNHVEVLDDLD